MQPVCRKYGNPLRKASYFCYGYKKHVSQSLGPFGCRKDFLNDYNQAMANGSFPVIVSIIRSSGVFSSEVSIAII